MTVLRLSRPHIWAKMHNFQKDPEPVSDATCGTKDGCHARDMTSIRKLASEPSIGFALSVATNDEEPRTKSILLGKSCENGTSGGEPFPIMVACRSDSTPTSPADDASPLHRGSIRFQPRVRITSGLHGSRSASASPTIPTKSSGLHGPRSASASPTILAKLPVGVLSESPFATSQPSTRSSSISSSISAPIRFREQESVPSKWGPLGRRVSMFASQKRRRRSLNDVKSNWDSYAASQGSGSERTPLLRSQEVQVDHEEVDREMDVVFGRWPGRLLNRHWWWWQVEPYVCCWWCANDDILLDE